MFIFLIASVSNSPVCESVHFLCAMHTNKLSCLWAKLTNNGLHTYLSVLKFTSENSVMDTSILYSDIAMCGSYVQWSFIDHNFDI